ncbi:MAG: cupin domain-containing protein [Paracoccaceae bacterium]
MTQFHDSFATDLSDVAPLQQAGNLPNAPLASHIDDVPLSGGTDPAFGEVRWRTLIDGTDASLRDLVLGIAEFGPGDRLFPHRHAPAEFYLGLDGDGVVTIDGEPHAIGPGVAIYVPGNAEHGTVAGANGLRFAYGFASGSFDGISYVFSATA